MSIIKSIFQFSKRNNKHAITCKEIYVSLTNKIHSKYYKTKYDYILDKRKIKFKLDYSVLYNWKKEWRRIITTHILENYSEHQSDLAIGEVDITEFPKEIGKLIDIAILFINMENIHELPKEIYNLVNLKVLIISNTPIKHIHNKISRLVNLKRLNITETNLHSLPNSIYKLPNLKDLCVNRSPISTLPISIKKSNLEALEIAYSNIKYIPCISSLVKLNIIGVITNVKLSKRLIASNNLRRINVLTSQYHAIARQIKKIRSDRILFKYDAKFDGHEWKRVEYIK